MTSEATRITVWGIMHINMGVVEVNDFKSFITSYLWVHWGHLEATMALKATKMAIKCNTHIDVRVVQDVDFKFKVKFSI